jgi:hypothetical protein
MRQLLIKSLISNLFLKRKILGIEKVYKYDPAIEALILETKPHIDVAREINIHPKTLTRWCRRDNIFIKGKLIDPYHLRLIYQTYGKPNKLIPDEKSGNKT